MQPVTYIKDTISELKKVQWPSRQATTKLTIIVIAISLLVGAYIGGLDYVFTNLLTILISR